MSWLIVAALVFTDQSLDDFSCCSSRYHPTDDEDEITETSVGGGTDRVVLRSKLLWALMLVSSVDRTADAFFPFPPQTCCPTRSIWWAWWLCTSRERALLWLEPRKQVRRGAPMKTEFLFVLFWSLGFWFQLWILRWGCSSLKSWPTPSPSTGWLPKAGSPVTASVTRCWAAAELRTRGFPPPGATSLWRGSLQTRSTWSTSMRWAALMRACRSVGPRRQVQSRPFDRFTDWIHFHVLKWLFVQFLMPPLTWKCWNRPPRASPSVGLLHQSLCDTTGSLMGRRVSTSRCFQSQLCLLTDFKSWKSLFSLRVVNLIINLSLISGHGVPQRSFLVLHLCFVSMMNHKSYSFVTNTLVHVISLLPKF